MATKTAPTNGFILLGVVAIAAEPQAGAALVMWVGRDRIWITASIHSRAPLRLAAKRTVIVWDLRPVLLVPPSGRLVVRARPE
jgi:hypothetical protein